MRDSVKKKMESLSVKKYNKLVYGARDIKFNRKLLEKSIT